MALMGFHSNRRHDVGFLLALSLLCGTGASAAELTLSARVDRTRVDPGQPINLIITLSGDLEDAQMRALELPEGFVIAGRSQASSFSLTRGAMQRSVDLVYVLIPGQPGEFTLGPFTLEHKGQSLGTEPITIVVSKPALPPGLAAPPGGRFDL